MRAYLDHAATTPLRPCARAAMLDAMAEGGNPSSAHTAGRRARARLEAARRQVAAFLGADPRGVVFVSGATEAIALALRGLVDAAAPRAFGAGDHPAVRQAAGAHAAMLPRDGDGRIRLGGAPPQGGVLSLPAVDHETGVVHPVVGARSWAPSARIHVDASQGLDGGWSLGPHVDAVTLAAHKLGGPVGIGALVLGPGVEVRPLFSGSQERGRRAGTQAVALAAGFGAACEAASLDSAAWASQARAWQTQLDRACREAGGRVVGASVLRRPSHTLAVFDGILGEDLVAALDLAGVEVSAGAACASGSHDPSPGLVAMGDPSPRSGLRLSTGWSTSQADVDHAAAVLGGIVSQVRAASG